MARIPESEIERIKQQVAIERLVEASGVQLKRRGKDLFGRCPFHAPDNTPSLSVTLSANLWNCLGACQEGGDVFKWVMKMQGVSFRHAFELLNTDPSLAAASGVVKQGTVRKLPAPVAPDAEGQTLKNQTMDFYQERLKHSPAGLGYLEKRGIRSLELIERFQLGFADRTLGLRLPEKNRVAGRRMPIRCKRSRSVALGP